MKPNASLSHPEKHSYLSILPILFIKKYTFRGNCIYWVIWKRKLGLCEGRGVWHHHATVLASVFIELVSEDSKSNGIRFSRPLSVFPWPGMLSPRWRVSGICPLRRRGALHPVVLHDSNAWLAPVDLATRPCSEVACCPEPSQGAVRLRGRRQCPFCHSPRELMSPRQPKCLSSRMHCFITTVLSVNAFNGLGHPPTPRRPLQVQGFCVFLWIARYSLEFPMAFYKSETY